MNSTREGPVTASALPQPGCSCAQTNTAQPFKQTLSGGWAGRGTQKVELGRVEHRGQPGIRAPLGPPERCAAGRLMCPLWALGSSTLRVGAWVGITPIAPEKKWTAVILPSCSKAGALTSQLVGFELPHPVLDRGRTG